MNAYTSNNKQVVMFLGVSEALSNNKTPYIILFLFIFFLNNIFKIFYVFR